MPVESLEDVDFFSCTCLGIKSTRSTLQLNLMGEVIVKPPGGEVERGGSEQQEERAEEGKGRLMQNFKCCLCLVLSVFGSGHTMCFICGVCESCRDYLILIPVDLDIRASVGSPFS